MHGIGTLVTKDGGQAGGTDAKIAAARQEGCRVVVVARLAAPGGTAVASIEDLIREVGGWSGTR